MPEVKDFPLDHIGVAVRNLDDATNRYRQSASVTILAEEEVQSQMVRVRFIRQGDQKIELLEATSAQSPIAKYLEKAGEGIHHLAFRVTDIHKEMDRLRTAGFEILQDYPIRGALNKWVFFIHPRSTGGTLVEICQPINEVP